MFPSLTIIAAAAVSHAKLPGFDPSTLLTLTNLKVELPLPTWIPEGFSAEVTEGIFNVNGQRFITVEYSNQDPKKSFAFEFAAVELGNPIFADETARSRRINFTSPGLGKSYLMTATVRGLPECQTPWINFKSGGFPRYGLFVSLGIKPDQALKILKSVKK